MSWFFIVGLIMIVDDIIGHYKRSLGKKEEFILEPIFRPLINKLWNLMQ